MQLQIGRSCGGWRYPQFIPALFLFYGNLSAIVSKIDPGSRHDRYDCLQRTSAAGWAFGR